MGTEDTGLVRQFDIHLKANEFPEWLVALKKKAFEDFLKTELPKPNNEDWRFTNPWLLEYEKFPMQENVKIEMESKNPGNSVFSPLSKAFGETPVKEAVKDFFKKAEDKPSLYNAAFFSDGIYLSTEGEKADFHARIENTGSSSALFSVIEGKQNSGFSYVEENICGIDTLHSNYSSHSVLLNAGENSHFNYHSLQEHGANSLDVSLKTVLLGNDASGNVNAGIFGGKLSRTIYDLEFMGKGSNLKTTGSYYCNGEGHIDLHTNSHHIVENTTNDILVKGVLNDSATSVYRGLIKIEKKAQKTNSYLADNTLLLGEKAVMNSIPSLMIDANDVKASHGATITQVDQEQLFYIQSRGLPKKQAEKLVVEGFYYPAIDKITDENTKQLFLSKWKKWLNA